MYVPDDLEKMVIDYRDMTDCLTCNLQDIEDIYHFVCVCPCSRNHRAKLLKQFCYVRPRVFSIYEFLASHEKKTLRNLGIFLKESFKIRGKDNMVGP